MTYRLLLFLGLTFLLLFSYLLYLNPQPLTFTLGSGLKTEGTLPLFILISFAAGGLGMIFLLALKAAVQYIGNFRQLKRRHRGMRAENLQRQGVEKWFMADYRKGAKLLQKAASREAGLSACQDLARLQLDAGKPQEALAAVEQGLKREPENPQLHWLKVEVLERLGDDLRLLNQLVYLKNRYPHNRYVLTMLAEKMMAQSYWQEAMAAWQELIKLAAVKKDKVRQAEVSGLIRNCRYELAVQRGLAGDQEAARQLLKELLDDDPAYVPAYILQASLAEAETTNAKRISEAIAILKQGYRRQPNAWYLLKGERLLSAGDGGHDQVEKYYRKAISRAEDYWPARLLLAFFLLDHQALEQADSLLAGLQRQLADSPLVELLAGELSYRQSRQLNEAADHFKRALGLGDKLPLTFSCSNCQRYDNHWLPRCPRCGAYNTYDLSPEVIAVKGGCS
ncbi:MAG: tetratricopeptide repeat protein [Deltaproteobacteria bacterium]|nr:tetratricopeptide repeat protein [Candidatus Anaeroferrophillus wilburensis]MBN2889241.1 tetratricopeptide repeat protein [Deltaproteobacteria bacterium]